MSRQMSLPLTTSVTSLPESVAGPLPLDLPVGQKNRRYGPAASPDNLSARQAKERGLLTSGTYGQRSFGSSGSVALQSSLASRLVQRLPLHGGLSWQMTWQERTTPQLRQICQLRASGLRIKEPDYFGWGTPTFQEGNGSDRHNQRAGSVRQTLQGQARATSWPTPRASREGKEKIEVLLKGTRASSATVQMGLASAVQLAVWATPTVNDSKNNGAKSQLKRKSLALNCQVQAAAWSTPLASDGKGLKRARPAIENRHQKKYGLALPEQTAHLITGLTVNGSTAAMERKGQLNPAFVCWLMGFPAEWLPCAASATPSSRN